jgi:small-conductance mechanosensitive channel
VGIGYGDDSAQARQLSLEAVRGVEGVLPDPAPAALVIDLGESPVNIPAHRWINPLRPADVLDAQDRVLKASKNKLSANGIDLPSPTRQILFHDQTEATNGNRRRPQAGPPARAKEALAPEDQPPKGQARFDSLPLPYSAWPAGKPASRLNMNTLPATSTR